MTRTHDPVFYADLLEGTHMVLSAEDSSHLIKARRVEVGDRIRIGDGRGTMCDAVVVDAGPPVATEIVSRETVQEPHPRMICLKGFAKSDRNEWVIQKLVEIGVDEIVFFIAERSVVRWDESKSEKMRARHESIAKAAAKQSRRAWLPRIEGPVSFREALATVPAVCYMGEAGAPPLSAVSGAPPVVGIVVGPEGGFTAGETEAMKSVGVIEVGLGPNILRSETAALVLATLARHAHGLI